MGHILCKKFLIISEKVRHRIEYKIVFYHLWLNDHDQRGIFGIDDGIFGINEFIFGINDHD